MKRCQSWPKILEALTRPMTSYELAPQVHLVQRSTHNVLRQLHAESLVHIVGWVHRAPPGPLTPVWAYGPGRDAPCPRPLSGAQKMAKHRARLTSSQREALLIRRRVARPDLAASWFAVTHQAEE